MKYLLCIILIFPCLARSTEQYREILRVDGYPFEFHQHPLEQFISEEKFIALYDVAPCSAAWRGYQGTWVITGNKLYLQHLNLTPCSQTIKTADLTKIFPNKEHGVEASWVNMELVVPIGAREFIWGEEQSPIVEFQAVVYKIENGIVRGRVISRVKQ